MDLDARCRAEIEGLHEFFEGWLNGTTPVTPDAFRRLDRAFHPSFEMITPAPTVVPRLILLKMLEGAHGARAGQDPVFHITIRNCRGRPLSDSHYLSVYEEWQLLADGPKGRLSSAVFTTDPDAPNGVQWVHLHEVWLPAETA